MRTLTPREAYWLVASQRPAEGPGGAGTLDLNSPEHADLRTLFEAFEARGYVETFQTCWRDEMYLYEAVQFRLTSRGKLALDLYATVKNEGRE